ncbi:type II secretion system major pseudopilin GspG [Xanthomonadaceae bacterium JHOS43]|nr:type II secretion system major pseudopilin GspG [Xanthomonadaceae bacterium JHOS43]MCX7562953.1 type II secretion system major pseudopilin GspG [Xanthomonadaceae bacterium XH05]
MIPSRFPPVNPCRGARGFTLIEVLVVVVILGILAAVVVPRFLDKPGEARQMKAKSDIQAISTSLNMYRLDNFAYPSTNQGLDALVSQPGGLPEARNWKAGGYIDRVPKDPWGRDYVYLSPGQRGDFDLYTLGADGQPGGEGENADVASWDN